MSAGAVELLDYGSRDAWLASRPRAIGASEVAGLFTDGDGNSLSPYTNAHVLYLERTGQVAPVELTAEYVEMGNLMEPVIAGIYEQRTGRKLWQGGQFCVAVHPTIPRLRATPDRWVVEAPDREGAGLVQLKNANAFVARDWDDGPPQHIEIQVQAEMCVTGRDWDSVAVVFGGNRFEKFDIERNSLFIEELEEQVRWFWGMVESRTAPPIDGSARTLEAIKRLHPNDSGETVRLPEEAVEWFDALEEAKRLAKEAEARETACKSKLLAAIGAATFGELPDGRLLSLKTSSNPGGDRRVEPYTYRSLRLAKKPTKGPRP